LCCNKKKHATKQNINDNYTYLRMCCYSRTGRAKQVYMHACAHSTPSYAVCTNTWGVLSTRMPPSRPRRHCVRVCSFNKNSTAAKTTSHCTQLQTTLEGHLWTRPGDGSGCYTSDCLLPRRTNHALVIHAFSVMRTHTQI
jgi:hypothetical protein